MAKSDLFAQFGDRTMPVLGNGHRQPYADTE